MHISAGRLLFARGYPRGRRANSGEFSIPESAGVGAGAQNRIESLTLSSGASRTAHFFAECGPRRLSLAQNPVCRHPRLLNTPKNARRILPQALAARRRIASASLVTAGGPRAYLPNLSAGRKGPAARSAQRGPDMSEDDLGGNPAHGRWDQNPAMLLMCSEANAVKIQSAHVV